MQAINKDGLGSFLQRMGKKQLLTHEQELSLARQVQAMVAIQVARQSLTEQLGYVPRDEQLAKHLDISESQLKRTHEIGMRAKNTFIECNLKLVVSITKKYTNRGMLLEDLIQEGAIGAGQAALKFDPDKGYKFSTYATWWIRQAITRALGNDGNMIRLPLHIIEAMNKIKRASSIICQERGRQPTLAEIDEFYAWSSGKAKMVCESHRAATRIDSINRKVGKDIADTEISDLLANRHNVNNSSGQEYSPLYAAIDKEARNDIKMLLECLEEKEASIVRLYYGLDGFSEMKLSAIANLLSLSRERVRQIKAKAIYKIKNEARRIEI